eukprot:CAMPEP_0172499330 /NCGR_PEP_ID=MMETSP1066-20121228/125689_1 /TAXON_ID=671091 /ORGANISM="Coscinodiscus wailesii, Strain CCMP2513" /LENGTH=140 /DNA_ID=CAMNT_0013273017 /DNA_START=198 /DNA_END=617 /DNA_ORIENTATION=-
MASLTPPPPPPPPTNATSTSCTIPLPPTANELLYTPPPPGGTTTSSSSQQQQPQQTQQQPHTTPIAHVPSHPNPTPYGSLIATSPQFICYAVKAGLVRVLHRDSPQRTLLRGHDTRVTDISFFTANNVLGTVGGGKVLIW